MKKFNVETSPQFYAGIGGVLYLIVIVLGIIQEVVVRGSIVVSGNAAATSASSRTLFVFTWSTVKYNANPF